MDERLEKRGVRGGFFPRYVHLLVRVMFFPFFLFFSFFLFSFFLPFFLLHAFL